jgi:hydrogenase maturation protease
MRAPRILIAGIGNIFLGDDAFGVEVARQLARVSLGEGVRVVDFGIRGIDLTYALLDGCDVAILVDAVSRGAKPGTLYLIEPDVEPEAQRQQMSAFEGHDLDPAKVLKVVRQSGGTVRVLLVGCEPTPFDPEQDVQMELSPPVRAAVDRAVERIESLVTQIRTGEADLMRPVNQGVSNILQEQPHVATD